MAHVTFYVAKTFILLHLFPKDLHNSHIHETLSLDVGLDIPLVAGVCLSHKVIPILNTSLCSLQFTRQAFCCHAVTSDTWQGMRQESPKKLFVIKIVQQLKIVSVHGMHSEKDL